MARKNELLSNKKLAGIILKSFDSFCNNSQVLVKTFFEIVNTNTPHRIMTCHFDKTGKNAMRRRQSAHSCIQIVYQKLIVFQGAAVRFATSSE